MRLALLLVAALGSAACVMHPAGPMQHDSSAIERDKAEMVRVDLRMGAGELRIDSGADKLANATFDYNVAAWKPEVRYTSSGGTGDLTIRQPNDTSINFGGSQRNEWSVRLSRDVPMEITAHFGAGDATLNLGGLDLRRVEMSMGAGDLNLDLRGTPKTSYSVNVSGGVGDSKVYLPSGVGIEAFATKGVGEIEASGLHQDGNRYYNDAFANSPVKIHLDIHGGVGDIHLFAGG